MRHEPLNATNRESQERTHQRSRQPSWRAAITVVMTLLVGGGAGGCVAGRLRVAQSEHIRLTTDNHGPEAYELVRAMERDYRALVEVFFACAEAQQAEPLDVVALVDDGSFQRLVPQGSRGAGGVFSAPPQRITERPATLAMKWYPRMSGMRQLFRHEITHSLIARCMPQAPGWLHEGMAEWLSTAEVDEREVRIGIPPYFVGDLRGGTGRVHDAWVEGVPLSQFLRVDAIRALPEGGIWVANDPHQTHVHYASAWALAALLGTGPPPLRRGFAAYRRALSTGAEEGDAWDAHLGMLPLQEHYAAFLSSTTRDLATFPLREAPDPGPILETGMSGDDVGLFWVRHMPWGTEAERHAALDMLDSVVARSPTLRLDADVASLRASILLEGGDVAAAEQVIRWVRTPEDVGFSRLALRLAHDYTSPPFPGVGRSPLAASRTDRPSAEEVRTLTTRARTPFEHDVLARAWLHLEEFGPALGEAHLAVSEDAACAECWVTLGLAQIQTGDVQRGARSLDRGAALMRTSHGGRGSWVRRAGLFAYGAMGRRQCDALPAVSAPAPTEPEPSGSLNAEAPAPLAPAVPGLSADTIRQVVRSNIDSIVACYEDELALVPMSGGTVQVRFVIRPDGSVVSAELHESEIGDTLGCCVLTEIMTWRFQPTGGGLVSVTYPFTLSHD